MYCRYCGKEIADDSKYCQHCGEKLVESIASSANSEDETKGPRKPKNVIEIPKIKTHLSEKQEMWIGIYAVWAVLNFLLIFIDGNYDEESQNFFPFGSDYLKYYDFSEFLVYAVLLPLVVFLVYKYRAKIKSINLIDKIRKFPKWMWYMITK